MKNKLLTLIVTLTLTVVSLQANRALQLKQMKVEQRVALVIGNNTYKHKKLTNLKNPVNDARAMKAKLQKLGFSVVYGENLTVRDMDKKLNTFSNKLSNGGVGLFFFAGHGIEYKHENYLMAKNSNINNKNDVKYESLPLNKILDSMEDAGNRLNIVLLDACRNDPFSRGGSGGLAKSTARGTFIVYATSPGDVASDGNGKHGAFTQEVLNNIASPGMSIERVFKNVKVGVINATNRTQRPWVSNDITGDFYFVLPTYRATNTPSQRTNPTTYKNRIYPLTITPTPSDARVSITNIKPRYTKAMLLKSGIYKIKVAKKGYTTKYFNATIQGKALSVNVALDKKTNKQSQANTPKPKVKLQAGEKEFWSEVKAENTKDYYEMYLSEYPTGYYVRIAKSFIQQETQRILNQERAESKAKENQAWNKVKNSKYGSDFTKFIKDFPSSTHTKFAKLKAKKYKNNFSTPKNFVHIKAGSFTMGSSSGDADEKPTHRVTIPYDFYIGKYEVTFQEYDKFCEATSRTKPKDEGWGRGNRPVINVSWNDAKAYTNWLSQKTGKTYRLPTESEWEYVARAGTNTKYSFRDNKNNLDAYAWYRDNSNSTTHPVGQKRPNLWGVYDMHGNVWEWCEDWYVDNYNNTPTNGTDNNSGSQKKKLLRGGSWGSFANYLRSAIRSWNTPSDADVDNGFRVVLLREH